MPDQITTILSRHTGQKDELIPILQEVQEELGYLPAEAMRKVAKFLRITENTAFGVATFYAQFKFVPSGKKTVRVCRGTACHVRGSANILRKVEKRLGVKPGQTTPDFEYTLETVNCIGACALAPTMTINKDTYGQMTSKKVAEVFGDRSTADQW